MEKDYSMIIEQEKYDQLIADQTKYAAIIRYLQGRKYLPTDLADFVTAVTGIELKGEKL